MLPSLPSAQGLEGKAVPKVTFKGRADGQRRDVGGGFQLLEAGSFVSGQARFEDQGRTRIMLKNKGLRTALRELQGKLRATPPAVSKAA